jgi:hypothetical protein
MNLVDSFSKTLGVMLLLVTGCGGGLGTVTGKVTYQNRALVHGSVVILGADGVPKTAAIGADGSYAFYGVPSGEVKVAVHSPDPAGLEMMAQEAMKKRQPGVPAPTNRQPSGIDGAKWMPIPDHYGDFNRSGLKTTVRSGTNTFNIDLQ